MVLCEECNKPALYNYAGLKPIVCFRHKTDGMQDVSRRLCSFDSCTKPARYNYYGSKAVVCHQHKNDKMIDVTRKLCSSDGCTKRAHFNIEGLPPIVCHKHITNGMIDVVSKRCGVDGCKTRPQFNMEGLPAMVCAKHKTDGMIDVKKRKLCNVDGCKTRAGFNYIGQKPLVCSKHKQPNMVDICKHNNKNKKNDETNKPKKKAPKRKVNGKLCKCGTRANYGFEGDKTPNYCSKCKDKGMINLRNYNQCVTCGKGKSACYNYFGEKKGKYCGKHKEDGMVNVLNKTCEEDGCTILPVFGFKEENIRRRCKKHKQDGMMNLKNKNRCETCGILANFNYQGEKLGIRCFKHKEPNMIDVHHRTCDKCTTRPHYGYPGVMPSRCFRHIEPNMIMHPTKKCKGKNENGSKCTQLAVYGYRCHEFCDKHNSKDMKNFLEHDCEKCGVTTIISQHSKQCEHCHEFFTLKIRRGKEMEVKHFLERNGFVYISHDQMIAGSYLKNRPDFLFLSNDGSYYVILEVDEFQHDTRPEFCECTRMFNLSQALGKPVMFLRFNPDPFKVDGKICNIGKAKRMEVLEMWLTSLLNKTPEEIKTYGFLSCVQLFYDGYKDSEVEIVNITPFAK